METDSLAAILRAYGYTPESARLAPMQEGYINQSYLLCAPGFPDRLLQQISLAVFPDIDPLMENLQRVLPLLQAPDYHPIQLIPASSGESFIRDNTNAPWRLLSFVENSRSYGHTDNPEIAFECGRIVGRFHQLLEGVDVNSFPPVLVDFHNLEVRLEQLRLAEESAARERMQKASPWISQVGELARYFDYFPWESLPLRLCHNDTKLSNFLFDEASDKGRCLVDLDTIMPGYLLYDLGDILRMLIQPFAEDHPNYKELYLRPEYFEVFCQGLASSGLYMTPAEKGVVAESAFLMPLLHGIRGLTDYLEGDRHYRVVHPEQNLVRASNLITTARLVHQDMDNLKQLARSVLD
ncbi:Phosphotransferase enzyme family protein [Robiginitalea myxolifaciens]|uniref:Phosphotransferase enzyme family protein n=1 Tax=Robiginitalea myxolifaciens TaxID=400055 RepID=A0A1I6FV18_9FLAO|nr:aminoglycoside phosphotransferase family protein [Robiginitalea myxolifaciens]SFR33780.1 Phosphotransferase enzyme family protein [Robiginitalea myxolifaciens]